MAAAYDNKGAVRLLLKKGFVLVQKKFLNHSIIRVDPKKTGSYGMTAMDVATEHKSMEVVELLWGAIGEEIPDKVKLQQLSKAMYKEDTYIAMKKFSELLNSLTPELVRI